ncbi:MAG: extracellular solute-binding protein [Patescibacteria group bacterium]|nr:extracellular solute-binding protein [Patescibacteria group bacterium]
MKTFPAIVTGIFGALAVGAVIIFATFSAGNHASIGTVVIWGSVPKATMDTFLSAMAQGNTQYSGVKYVEVPASQLTAQLVQAIASGTGPDLVILPESELLGETSKLQIIPYASFSKLSFQNAFLQSGNAFLSGNGAFGLPFTIDPLVMYWNRALFANASLTTPPSYWDDFSSLAPKLSKADQNGTLTESAVALGTWSNVTNAKAILVSILGELGNPIITLNTQGGYQSTLLAQSTSAALPVNSLVTFYTDFADPTKPVYSWNSSMANSFDAFTAGKVAVYFGFASELQNIRAANPNLDFAVAPLPAIRGGGSGSYADVSAVVIPRGAPNPSGALTVAEAMTTQPNEEVIASALMLPSVRNDANSPDPANPYAAIFRTAAIKSFGFLDPNPASTDSIFQQMIENVSSGKLSVSDATTQANSQLSALLNGQ